RSRDVATREAGPAASVPSAADDGPFAVPVSNRSGRAGGATATGMAMAGCTNGSGRYPHRTAAAGSGARQMVTREGILRGRIDRRLPKRVRPAWRVSRRTVANYLDEEGLQWAGAVAFYLVLSVPPLLIAAMSIGVVVVGP